VVLGVPFYIRKVCWSRPRCPELVAGSRKQVEVVMMATDVHGNLSRMGHMTGRAAHPVTTSRATFASTSTQRIASQSHFIDSMNPYFVVTKTMSIDFIFHSFFGPLSVIVVEMLLIIASDANLFHDSRSAGPVKVGE